ETLGVTPTTLGRICRNELGESPTSVINERTIREAQRQLAYTERDIKQIAHELGFADSAYFSRYFRKHAGQTPSEFRLAVRRVGAAKVARPGGVPQGAGRRQWSVPCEVPQRRMARFAAHPFGPGLFLREARHEKRSLVVPNKRRETPHRAKTGSGANAYETGT